QDDLHLQIILRNAAMTRKREVPPPSLEGARRDLAYSGRQLAPRPSEALAEVADFELGGRPARRYLPLTKPQGGPGIVFFHGGGFVLGGLESHDGVCRTMAAHTGCPVFAVDYRLAPEHPFPAAIDDALTAFRDAVARADHLGVDPERLGVAGDSAGGNLATLVGLETEGEPVRPAAVLAIYPAIDFTMSFPSQETLAEGYYLEAKNIRWYRETYLAGEDMKHPRASPWFRESVAGAPPHVVVTAGYDPLRDEGDAWAKRLEEAGVQVIHQSPPGLFHGFWNAGGGIEAARVAIEEGLDAFRGLLRS
ncbi:MAG: alpha/beta hydrolase, partial [Myxococcota bacterium]